MSKNVITISNVITDDKRRVSFFIETVLIMMSEDLFNFAMLIGTSIWINHFRIEKSIYEHNYFLCSSYDKYFLTSHKL